MIAIHTASRSRFVQSSILACVMVSAIVVPRPASGGMEEAVFPSYAVLDLPPVTYNESGSKAINDVGQVVGSGSFDPDWSLPFHGLRWDLRTGLQAVDLGDMCTDCNTVSHAEDINNAGWSLVDGWYETGLLNVAWLVGPDGERVMIDPLSPGRSMAVYAMNEAREVVGFCAGDDPRTAILWQDGETVALPHLNDVYRDSFGNDINESGLIAGRSHNGVSRQAVIWRDGAVFAVGPTDHQGSELRGVNDQGVAVGDFFEPPFGTQRAFIWRDGEWRDIHQDLTSRFGQSGTFATKINNRDEVVGTALVDPFDDIYEAFIWRRNEARLYRDLAPANPAWTMHWGNDINDKGWVTGFGWANGIGRDNLRRALVMIPVSPTIIINPPSSLTPETNTEIIITNAPPGERVVLVWGLYGGGEKIIGCSLDENLLQVENPRFLGAVVANANGNARYRGYIPREAAGRTLVIQALNPARCAISNLIEMEIEP